MANASNPPGAPGIPPRWTSSSKSGVGTSLNRASRVWFTLSHGIFNEIYYPRLDQACIRDMGLIVTDGADFFSEEKRNASHKVEYLSPNVPAYKLTNTCLDGRYRIEKEVIVDPQRDVILQNTRFVPLSGSLADYHVYVLLAPHLGNQGEDNTAWAGEYKGIPMLMAERDGIALALACSAPWLKRSAGYVGTSDGWQDLFQHRQMTWEYTRAENGNVALTGEIDLSAAQGSFLLALGFGQNTFEAAQRAQAAIYMGFKASQKEYVREWQAWQKSLINLTSQPAAAQSNTGGLDYYHISTAVMRIHEAKSFPGGLIASLSIPWGFAKGDDDLGGYHLVWPRDLAEMAGGLLAAGAHEDALRVINYLQTTQEPDGHWPQNMWLDGRPYWGGIQMDETAFPLILLDQAWREKCLNDAEMRNYWPMTRKAASFIAVNGPVTQQDRWEEDPGYSPFTLAVEITGLLVAADQAELNNEPDVAKFLRETADAWNAGIERWIYVSGTDLAKQVGVEGYYVRVAPPETADAASPSGGYVPIKNRPPSESSEPAAEIISPDALALVRFGLRAPDDPRIQDTVKVIDALLKVDTPNGPAWHRYNDDGYGEHEDGSAFDGTGIGRAWPLLTGERAHYELAAGHRQQSEDLLHAMEAFSNEGGMFPEQIWDSDDIPDRELFCGSASGSAMPLGWAHAEYLKLLRSLHDGKVYDMPPQTVQRYLKDKTGSAVTLWCYNHKVRSLHTGQALRVETISPAQVVWSTNGWQTTQKTYTVDSGLGLNFLDIPCQGLPPGGQIDFTFYWLSDKRWEGKNFSVVVA